MGEWDCCLSFDIYGETHTLLTHVRSETCMCASAEKEDMWRGKKKIFLVPIPKLRSRLLGLEVLQMTDFKRIWKKPQEPSTDIPWGP